MPVTTGDVLDQFRLDGKTAIITGVGPGIGEHVARAYAAVGANVVVSSRNGERMDAIATSIEQAGGRAIGVAADVTAPDDLARLVDEARSAFGTVHIVFNNATAGAIAKETDPWDNDDDAWENAVNANLIAPFRLARALVPAMREAGYGRIINVLSTTGFTPVLPYIAYGSTKAGLHMLTRYLAKFCAPEVCVNALCPGSVTPHGEYWDVMAEQIPNIPVGRPGAARELVGAALLLASPASSYITGQAVFADGGRVQTVA